MVAPNYAATRSALAKQMGLGRKSKEPVLQPARRRRKPQRNRAAITQSAIGGRAPGASLLAIANRALRLRRLFGKAVSYRGARKIRSIVMRFEQ
jgi:hypothetical protein